MQILSVCDYDTVSVVTDEQELATWDNLNNQIIKVLTFLILLIENLKHK